MSFQRQPHIQVSLTRSWKRSFSFENPWLSKEKERNTKAPTTCQRFDLNDSPEIALSFCGKKGEKESHFATGKKKSSFLFILPFFLVHRAPSNFKTKQGRRPSLFSDHTTFPCPQAATATQLCVWTQGTAWCIDLQKGQIQAANLFQALPNFWMFNKYHNLHPNLNWRKRH